MRWILGILWSATLAETLVPATIPEGCALAVISVPDLQNPYTTVFEAVHQSVAAAAEPLA